MCLGGLRIKPAMTGAVSAMTKGGDKDEKQMVEDIMYDFGYAFSSC